MSGHLRDPIFVKCSGGNGKNKLASPLFSHTGLEHSYAYHSSLRICLLQIILLQMFTLSCSCPCIKVAISHKKQYNAHIYYSRPFINTLPLRHVSALKGPFSRSRKDSVRHQGEQNDIPDVKFSLVSSV